MCVGKQRAKRSRSGIKMHNKEGMTHGLVGGNFRAPWLDNRGDKKGTGARKFGRRNVDKEQVMSYSFQKS